MAELEDELKVQNWLSIVTFDVYKFIGAGGQVLIEQDGKDLVFRFFDTGLDTPGVNKKFSRLVSQALAGREVTP